MQFEVLGETVQPEDMYWSESRVGSDFRCENRGEETVDVLLYVDSGHA